MSANPVSKTHLDVLMTAALEWGTPRPLSYWSLERGTVEVTVETVTQIGQMLWSANWAATEEAEDPEDRYYRKEPVYRFAPVSGAADPLTVMKQTSYYGYQSAGDDPERWLVSEPAQFLDRLAREAVSRLPGYGEAPWEIDDEVVPGSSSVPGQEPAAFLHDASDPGWTTINEHLQSLAIPFEYTGNHYLYIDVAGIGPFDERGEWIAWSPERKFPNRRRALSVYLMGDENAAKVLFDHVLAAGPLGGDGGLTTAVRQGRVVSTSHANGQPDTWTASLRATPADQMWTSAEPNSTDSTK